jgi:hypothetical protein
VSAAIQSLGTISSVVGGAGGVGVAAATAASSANATDPEKTPLKKQNPTINAGRRQQEIRLIDRIVRLQKEERKTSAVPASAAQHRPSTRDALDAQIFPVCKRRARPVPTTDRLPWEFPPELQISPIFSSIFRIRDRAKNIPGNLRFAATERRRHNFRAWPCPGKRQVGQASACRS